MPNLSNITCNDKNGVPILSNTPCCDKNEMPILSKVPCRDKIYAWIYLFRLWLGLEKGVL
jgi:hypothetical protein